MNVTRWRCIDVRGSLTYIFYRRTSSCRAYVIAWRTYMWLCVPVPYASFSRTYSDDVRISRLHISTMHMRVFRRMCSTSIPVFRRRAYPRTYSIDVRMPSTYVLYQRTSFHDGWFRDYESRVEYSGLCFGDPDSGLRSRGPRSRDCAEHSGSDEEDRRLV